METIGVLIEESSGVVKEAMFGVFSYLQKFNCPVYAYVIGNNGSFFVEQLTDCGVDKIVESRFENEQDKMNPELGALAAAEAVKAMGVKYLFGLSSPKGRERLARIAAMLDAPSIQDCTGVDLAQKTAASTRYSGKTQAEIKFSGANAVFGIRPNHFDAVKTAGVPEVISIDPPVPAGAGKVCYKGIACAGKDGIDLTEAQIIVSGGRGMKAKEHFSLLYKCAEKLNAAVGASRVAVDSGWAPYAIQVGQTGLKVNPKVYIAFGISGSVQHFAGMKTSGLIIAVNWDENAPIIKQCDYYVVGNLFEIIECLIRQLQEQNPP